MAVYSRVSRSSRSAMMPPVMSTTMLIIAVWMVKNAKY